ncbi:polysaccharide pyruvyl transferase family protein [Desulfogranum japonicum]|uniref:polysaccharide pyruvyl transferase family protein n=1 Tax=Desulfogranum japonicum TaxID=231447 RepID=UPI00041EF574|nr:polysaccharide pyruvyl transferase family protein [Desulfogranum japonicum]
MSNKISIWSPLRYANYGDDMQAVILAKYLTALGYSVKLYQLEEGLAERYNLESAPTIEKLCEDVKLCIIAGGALLTPFNIAKRCLHKAAIEYENDFKDLYNATKSYPVKFCAISMGGDGQLRIPQLYYSKSRINFFKSDSFLHGTVRLAGDIEQMKRFGKIFKYYPDMLFQAPNYFECQKLQPTEKFRVGINFKKGKYLDKQLLSDIHTYAEKYDDIEFHFTTSHMEKVGLDYQYVPSKESKNIKIARYEYPDQLLGVLGSMDIFITSMLHLGMTGLTVGTPFISYRGPGKTKSFLHSIGGDWAIVNDNIRFEELKNNFFSKSREELFRQFDESILSTMIKESESHFEFCKEIAESYG